MAVKRLSEIALASSPPALTDTVVGVGGGTTDLQYTLTQIKSTVGGGGGTLTVGATPVAGGTDNYALTVGGGTLGDTPIRTTLIANVNYYVATTGNDSNDGSLAHPWATIQHAMNFVSANLDLAGFTVIVNIGAGTFVGAGMKQFLNGRLEFRGAGVASTFTDNGPNDGTYNDGTPYSSLIPTFCSYYFSEMTIAPTTTAGFGLMSIQAGFTEFIFGGHSDNTPGHINFTSTVTTASILEGAGEGAYFQDGGTIATAITITGNCGGFFDTNIGVTGAFNAAYTLSGTPAWINGFLTLFDYSFCAFFGSITGTATGNRFVAFQGSNIDTGGNALTGAGSTFGNIDNSSSYNGVLGNNTNYNQPLTGFSITLNNGDTQVILDPAGTLAAGTIVMPAVPIPGQLIMIRTSQVITTLTINGNSGQTIAGYVAGTLALGGVLSAVYKSSNSTWYF